MATLHALRLLAEMPAWLAGFLKVLLVLGVVVCGYLVAYEGIYAHKRRRKRKESGETRGN